jgi:hypothetical protein
MWLARCERNVLSHTTSHSKAMRLDDCRSLAGLERLQTIFAAPWDGFTRVYPRYDTHYYAGLVDKMLGCGNPASITVLATWSG